jgi:hypothetical protein
MKNILFVAHDPGGANVIKPVIEYFAKQPLIASYHLLLGPAKELIIAGGVNLQHFHIPSFPTPNFPNEQSVNEQDIIALLDTTRFDAMFTATSFNSNGERLCIRCANERGIPTFSILDFWSNYRQRFTLNDRFDAPLVLFVADKRMHDEAVRELPATRVVISGNPHLRSLAARYKEARSQYGSDTQGIPTRLRFFCENIRHYYPDKPVNEFTVIPKLLRALFHAGFEGELLIRPHPMESREPWQTFIAEQQNTQQQANAPRLHLALDTASFDEVLRDRCVAIGFTTMALLETASVGIPTFSYQIDVPSDYFNLPFEEYGITRLVSESDVANIMQLPETRGIAGSLIGNTDALAIIHGEIQKAFV